MKLLSSELSAHVADIFDHNNYQKREVKTQIVNIISEINNFYCTPIITLGWCTNFSVISLSSTPDFKQPFNLSVKLEYNVIF